MKEKQNVQLEPPALAGRKQRIQDFRVFVEANRKDKTASQITALYSMETGLSIATLEKYLKVYVQAGVYARPNAYVSKNMLLTPTEYKIASEERRKEEEKKRLKAKFAPQYTTS